MFGNFIRKVRDRINRGHPETPIAQKPNMVPVVNGPYGYVAGPSTLGIGVDNLALIRGKLAIDEPIYGPRYNVRRDFAPLTGASQFPLGNIGPLTDIRGDGVYLSGQLVLGQLTETRKNSSIV
jgi:hypothetical protein